QEAYTGQIGSRPAEALDETARDRVRAAGKHDGDGGGGLFRGVRRDGTTGHDHRDLAADQISRQRRQPVIVTLGPTILDQSVLVLDVAAFLQAAANRLGEVREGSG